MRACPVQEEDFQVYKYSLQIYKLEYKIIQYRHEAE